MDTCLDCGMTQEGGNHYKSFEPLNEKLLGVFARLPCNSCKASVKLETVKEQGVENWTIIKQTGATFCPSCSHLIKN